MSAVDDHTSNKFLAKVIEKYVEVHEDCVEKELLRSHAIRELMEISTTDNQILLQKAMPIILSLFKEHCIDPYDSSFSKDSKDLTDEQVGELQQILTNLEK